MWSAHLILTLLALTVPIIAILTKFDALETVAFAYLRRNGCTIVQARQEMQARAKSLLQEQYLDRLKRVQNPPVAVVCLQDLDKSRGAHHRIHRTYS